MSDESLVYTPAEVFRLLKLSRATGYARLADGSIPHIRLQGKILIPRSAINKLLEQAGTQKGSTA